MKIDLKRLKSPSFWVTILVLNLLALVYLWYGREIFFWDNAGYWQISARLSELVFSRPLFFIRQVLGSILIQDYNYLPAMPIAIIMAVFGTSRMAFTLAVVNFYLVPLYAMIRLCTDTKAYITTLLFLPILPYLAIIGFLDVGGVTLAFAALLLYLYHQEKQCILCASLAGFLLFGLTVFRRWFIFFTIAVMLVAIVHAIYKRQFKRLFCAAAGFFIPMAIFHGFVFNVLLGGDFRAMYAAYRFPLLVDFRFTLFYYGIIPLVFIFSRIRRGNIPALFAGGTMILTYPLFLTIQSFGQHHLLLLAAPLAFILVQTEDWGKKHLALGLAVLTMISPFLPHPRVSHMLDISRYNPAPAFNPFPNRRSDAQEIYALAQFVKDLDGGLVLFASSFVLNPDLLNNTIPSLAPTQPFRPIETVLWVQQVDRRDGMPYSFIDADYILATSPTQIHLAPLEQLSVSIPNEAMLEETPLSAAFEQLDVQFTLEGGIQVYLFRRLRPNTQEEIDWLFGEIQAAWDQRDGAGN